ncbi:MAG: hypothetical protein QOI48_3282 [Solirubrobacteraceae bacterium]|jgi:hypothetical protein|nr:hypothetical protein [Solirubrobacteraceae bacterium]
MIGCNVTAATDSVGAPVADDDLILNALIADSDRAAPAKAQPMVEAAACPQQYPFRWASTSPTLTADPAITSTD